MNMPLDVLLRAGGAAVGLVFLLVVATSSAWRRRGDLMLLILCAVAYLLCSAPLRPCCTSPWTLPLLMGAAAFPFALWRLSRVVLGDQPEIGSLAWAGLVVLLVSSLLAAPDYLSTPVSLRTGGAVASKVAAISFVTAALWIAWHSWGGDLIEPRRRLRWWLVGYLGAYGLIVLASEIYLQGQQPPGWLDLLNAAAIAATLLATLVYFVQLRPVAMDTLFAPAPEATPPVSPEPPEPAAEPDATQPVADGPLIERLQALMESEVLYRDPELSVRTLAVKVAVPEYVLRRLINEKLGHRNFAAYVNEFRLREVEARLRDPQWLRRPILTLALEAGFGSIGPFNRAFRERHGMTPSEFRSGAVNNRPVLAPSPKDA
jgi:AraC-like DNA-binding protein